ncbi:MAG: hypothetical protein QOJ53_2291 [Sphingomonadales bacterium]|jgi:hypothetical protein|nr:hypothetical protein [Sphingomonadales bacterium]
MNAGPAVSAIAHQIQLAVAPVFLLAGIGSILNVLAGRLARVVERARQLERDFASFDEEARAAATAELVILDKRMMVVNLALSACTAAALFVCVLVAMLFVANLADIAFGRPVAWLFVLAMLLLILGLLLFLWEVRLAMRALRVRRAMMPHRRR